MAISGPDVVDFERASRDTFESLGAFSTGFPSWLLDRGSATQIQSCPIQTSVLSDLGLRPVAGRAPRGDDVGLGESVVSPVWISQRFWQSRFGSSPSAIGATVEISSTAAGLRPDRVRIEGVFPPGAGITLPFDQSDTDLWYPLSSASISKLPRRGTVFFMLGRLRRAATLAQAEATLTAIAGQLGERYAIDRRKRPVVQSLEAIMRGPVRQTMGLLSLGVGLVFLVGLMNLAILMRVEGMRRQQEIAVRAALGASRRRLWTELGAEKCMLTLVAVGLGVGVATALVHMLSDLLPAAGLGPALASPPSLNLGLLLGFGGFVLLLALVWSALLVAAADGRGAARSLVTAGGGPGITGFRDPSPRASRWRLGLLGAQACMGICLLAVAALTTEMYGKLSARNLGPDPRHTLLFSIHLPEDLRLPDSQAEEFNRQVLSRLERLPGMQAVGLGDYFASLGQPASFAKQGDPPGSERQTTVPAVSVSPGFFHALGIPIRLGRSFTNSDDSMRSRWRSLALAWQSGTGVRQSRPSVRESHSVRTSTVSIPSSGWPGILPDIGRRFQFRLSIVQSGNLGLGVLGWHCARPPLPPPYGWPDRH